MNLYINSSNEMMNIMYDIGNSGSYINMMVHGSERLVRS